MRIGIAGVGRSVLIIVIIIMMLKEIDNHLTDVIMVDHQRCSSSGVCVRVCFEDP